MNKDIYDLLEKRNFKNYMIETVSETVIKLSRLGEEKSATMTLDFDNCFITPSSADLHTFRLLLKMALVVIEELGQDVDEWTIKI